MILALGSAAIVAVGALAGTERSSPSSTEHSPSWRLYSPSHWAELRGSFAGRGFAASSVRVVTGTQLASGKPFAVISGRSDAGRTCFVVARGTTIGRTICRLSKPVTVFAPPDRCAACSPGRKPIDARTILGLVRADVTVTMVHDGRESGVAVVPAGEGFALNASPVRTGDRLRARDAHGHLLASIVF
jgi:hypothetical protein